jgi:Domain of unknown function (DUF4136)
MKRLLLVLPAVLLIVACAGPRTVSSEVSTYGEWPADRKPTTFRFERLPSQQSRPEQQQAVEDGAQRALETAGFKPAADGAAPDVLVQVGVRISRTDYSPWDDPLWWPGGFGPWRYRPWGGPWPHYGGWWGYPGAFPSSRYEREVAVLIRDRAEGKPLYEAHGDEGFPGGRIESEDGGG